MEDHGRNIVPKLHQFVFYHNCRKITKILQKMWKFFFLSILLNKSLMKYTMPKLKTVDRPRVLKKDIPLRKGYKPQLTDEISKISSKSTTNRQHISSKIS